MKNVNLSINNMFRLSLIALLLVLAGCDSFLVKPLQRDLVQANFPTTSADAVLATNGAYTTLRDNSWSFGAYPIFDIMSDDARKGSNPGDQAATIGPYDNFTNVLSHESVYNWYSTLYKSIRAANVVLERVPDIEMDAALKARCLGEASFLRALSYFDLGRGYGGVPLVTVTSPQTGLARANLSEVYDLVISDLLFAIDNLPEKKDYIAADRGRATKGAARALLAKVYLFYAEPGKLNYVPQPDFVNVEKYAMDLINSDQNSLEPNFIDANGVNGNFGVESVFEVGALPTENPNGQDAGGAQYANIQGVRGNPNRGWGFNRPTPSLRNSFEAGDVRLKGTIIDLGDVLDEITITGDGSTPDVTKDGNGVVLEVECYNRKVWTPGTDVPTQFGHHRRIIRYADVLLMAAEALNENNKPAEALVYLNMVRERARDGQPGVLPDVVATDKTILRGLILKERRAELALEGHRFFDLVRTGNAEAVMGPLGFEVNKSELLGIPQSEIDLSRKVIVQNQGWD